MARSSPATAALLRTPAGEISPGGLLHADFRGPSWDRWRAVLKAAWCEPLIADELKLFREVAERDPPTRRVRELWVVAGRRAGKDSIAAAVATIASLRDYSDHLRTGERVSIVCLAVDRAQAAVAHRYIAGWFDKLPPLRGMVVRSDAETLELANGVEIITAANSFRAVRGRTVGVAILDEIGYWRSVDTAVPDVEIYNALEPSMISIPDAMLIGISSPYRRSGLLYEKFTRHYGRPDDDVLVVRGSSETFNSNLSRPRERAIIQRRLEEDPEAGAAEYLAQWRSDVGDFLDRETVEQAIDPGITARAPLPNVEYRAFVDVSGGRGDSFACAIAHASDDLVIIDALHEWRPPFNSAEVVRELAGIARRYRVTSLVGDDYGRELMGSMLGSEGLRYEPAGRVKSEIYLEALPLFTSGRARLTDNARAAHQLISLERRSYASGRDRVVPAGKDRPDDLANVIAGALVLVSLDRRAQIIPQEIIRNPVPLPEWGRFVVAVLTVGGDGLAATVYLVGHKIAGVMDPPPLMLVDLDYAPLTAVTCPVMFSKVATLAASIRGVRSAFGFVPPAYLQHAELAGCPAQVIPDELLRDVSGLALNAAGHVHSGAFKVSAAAAAGALALPSVLEYRLGEDIAADPTKLAVLLGLALCLTPVAAGQHR
jgi:hypothetical protein